jgi:predicted nucleic acid-binding protein
MEALDVEQESMWFRSMIRKGQHLEWLLRNRRRRELTSRARGRAVAVFYKQFVAEVQDYVEWLFLDTDGWEEAIRIAMQTDASAPDCIHVATAVSHGCDVLVTSDEPLRRTAAGEIDAATPEEVVSWLDAAGV